MSHTPPFQPTSGAAVPGPAEPFPGAQSFLDAYAVRRDATRRELEAEARDYEFARVGPPSLADERDRELTRRALAQGTTVPASDEVASTPKPSGDVDVPDTVLCVVCGLPDGEFDDDVVAHWWDGRQTQLAHTDCADVNGWRLA